MTSCKTVPPRYPALKLTCSNHPYSRGHPAPWSEHVLDEVENNTPHVNKQRLPQTHKPRKEVLDSLLLRLEEEDREVIIHRDLEELSFKEIGEVRDKGENEDAIRKRYHRAFQKLVALADDKGDTNG